MFAKALFKATNGALLNSANNSLNSTPPHNNFNSIIIQKVVKIHTSSIQRRFISTLKRGKRDRSLLTQQQHQQPTNFILSTTTRPITTTSTTTISMPPSHQQQHQTPSLAQITHKFNKNNSLIYQNRRNISFNPGTGFKKPHNQNITPESIDPKIAQDDLRRFAFKKPQQYNMTQQQHQGQQQHPTGQNLHPFATPNQTTLTGHRLPNPGPNTSTTHTIKAQFLADPSVPRWRKDFVRMQDFLSDPGRPITLETDQTLTRIAKRIARMALAPSRRLWKFGRWFGVKIFGANRYILISLFTFIAAIWGSIYWASDALDRINMRISRELFVRSCVIDLAARLDSYGLLGYDQTSPILQSFKIFVADDEGSDPEKHSWYNDKRSKSAQQDPTQYKKVNNDVLSQLGAPKNFRGQEMMKSFLMQAMSLPVESSRVLEALYEPASRIDDVSEGIHLVMLEKLADTDPSQATEKCPPHIKAIASRTVEEWFKRTRLQMIEEKKLKLKKEMEKDGIDDLTQDGRIQIKEKLEEFNVGITFDLSKREKRKLFWKGILTGIMLETGLVGLENETTFLRLAREYALKGCVLRKIPEKVKISDEDLEKLKLAHTSTTADQSLIMANPAGEFQFSSAEELTKIRDALTQQPYSPDHGQIDNRFLNFVFGKEFCFEYGISPDLFPYLHQIAPLAILDLGSWTHPQTLFDLTHQNTPVKLPGSKYTTSPAEFEKVEMYNFMIDELIKKDKAYSYLDQEYKSSSISKDELIVLPLTQPQDSLRNPSKYGLRPLDSQVKLLGGRIPKCYEDTYGAYAGQIFLFDMVILRNFLEIGRLKRTLGELGTTRIRDMTIPSTSNYYGNYDRLLEGDLLDVIKQEETLTETWRLRGTDFKKEYDQRIKSDLAQLNIRDPLGKNRRDTGLQLDAVERGYQAQKEASLKDLQAAGGTRGADMIEKTIFGFDKAKADPHSVTVDAELYKELQLKPSSLQDMNSMNVLKAREDAERQKRAKKWVDNGSI